MTRGTWAPCPLDKVRRGHCFSLLPQPLAKETKTMTGGFAIVPDRTEQPAALFTDLEDAMEWGLYTLGADAFHIRWFDVVLVAPREMKRPIGAA